MKEPFVIINADDYYGREAFEKLHDFLVNTAPAKDSFTMAMAGFGLKNTLSENGIVTRGVRVADEENMLTRIVETTGIGYNNSELVCDNMEVQKWISENSKVSMNMWAGYPEFITYLEDDFKTFLSDPSGDRQKKEYLLPIIVGQLLSQGKATVKVLETSDKWIGITYQEDL